MSKRIETVEAAVEILNEVKWDGRDGWHPIIEERFKYPTSGNNIVGSSEPSMLSSSAGGV